MSDDRAAAVYALLLLFFIGCAFAERWNSDQWRAMRSNREIFAQNSFGGLE